jgi:hypothetical protein
VVNEPTKAATAIAVAARTLNVIMLSSFFV